MNLNPKEKTTSQSSKKIKKVRNLSARMRVLERYKTTARSVEKLPDKLHSITADPKVKTTRRYNKRTERSSASITLIILM